MRGKPRRGTDSGHEPPVGLVTHAATALRDPAVYADAVFETAWRSRRFPDICLRAFGQSYALHRVILASQSSYFATLLRWVELNPTGRVAGAGDGQEDAGLPAHDLLLGEDVTQRGFEWILEYFYASPNSTIGSDNAFDVLAAAHYLGVTAVQSACVEFLSQHLDPTNLTACLAWATRADHGEASDMLSAACRRVLALRLPRNLPAWAPALPHIEPRTLLDILASDDLAVQSEYDRYQLVKEVSGLFLAAEAEGVSACGQTVTSAAFDGTADDDGLGAAARDASGGAELQRLLSSALHISDERLAHHLQLSRSCPAAIPATPRAAAAAGGGSAATAAASATARLAALSGGTSPPCSAGVTGTWPSSQSSSRSTIRSSESCVLGVASFASEDPLGPIDSLGANNVAVSGGGCHELEPLAELVMAPPPALAKSASLAAAAAPLPVASSPTAAETVQMLLHSAVRYEHLTVPQLMAVRSEGLVAPHVLAAALWSRTRLDFEVHCAAATPTPTPSSRPASASSAASSGAAASSAASQSLCTAVELEAEPPFRRPYRMCWRLTVGALRKLQPSDMLQSDQHEYAGARWQLRLCAPSGAGGGGGGGGGEGRLGLYVGRHLMPGVLPPVPSSPYSHAPVPQPQPPAAAGAGGGGGGNQHRGNRPPAQPRHQPPPVASRPPLPFCAYADRQPVLRSRCRLAALQSDNTALQGRLVLGDTGAFDADFVAGGYYGRGGLVARGDLAALDEEAEVLVFATLEALVGGEEEAGEERGRGGVRPQAGEVVA
ncbi:hypothetical protein HYH03_004704 [Edaphochlamys debaryana]|uniref:BTB domain-containing protein n=1 Tax=Edaphochlamys debaryana TaxID=47281 RepID=A0A836C2V3_9CHLO|nr:hypothetical protein HYH03_004704 [Edaphochlamys debaryana]|eukprot:KAG2497113.1 hypothetical protein HYH03_004704 [Edaphochlamys debaryana]